MNRARGFTLIEMLMVIAIIGVIIAISVPAFQSYILRSNISQAKVDLFDIQKTITASGKSKGVLPDSLADVNLADRRDPWGRPYEYFNLRTAKGNGAARKDKKLSPLNSDFDLYSVGLDGVTQASLGNSKSRDDIVRARDGAFIGTAEEFDP
jgi:general secretion pathway protein G